MQEDIPVGYCHCGCGKKTNLSTTTKASAGHVRGEPHKFCKGHRKPGLSLKRFWTKVVKTESCWLWTGPKNRQGYGRARIRNTVQMSHRVSWELAHGPIPAGDYYGTTCVLHKCDVPACVNPDHLFLGTQRENVLDCKAKGRLNRKPPMGEQNGRSKLTNDDVLEIRATGKNRPVAETAGKYGVKNGIIYNILNRKSWKHLL